MKKVILNIYKISQNINNRYDTFDSIIVAALNEESARTIHPEGSWPKYENPYAAWCNTPDQVKVEYIGVADSKIEESIILSSFNAG